MTKVTCLTLADNLMKEATALRMSNDKFVECYFALARIFHDIDAAASKDDLDMALASNGTGDIDIELVNIMSKCINHFDTKDTNAKFSIAHMIMKQVHFLHFLHNKYQQF